MGVNSAKCEHFKVLGIGGYGYPITNTIFRETRIGGMTFSWLKEEDKATLTSLNKKDM